MTTPDAEGARPATAGRASAPGSGQDPQTQGAQEPNAPEPSTPDNPTPAGAASPAGDENAAEVAAVQAEVAAAQAETAAADAELAATQAESAFAQAPATRPAMATGRCCAWLISARASARCAC